MDLWGAFVFFFLVFLIVSCCGYCCSSKRRGAVLSTPVVVTSATHTGPGGYPVTVMPVPTGGYQTNIYTQAPTTVRMPMPMPMPMPNNQAQAPPPGFQTAQFRPQQMPPYPTMDTAAHMNPPTYDMAVGQPTSALYAKQAPYNPNFAAH